MSNLKNGVRPIDWLTYVVIAFCLISQPATAQSIWRLKSNVLHFPGGAKLDLNVIFFTSLDACEVSRQEITDLVQQMQPELVLEMGLVCIEGDGNERGDDS